MHVRGGGWRQCHCGHCSWDTAALRFIIYPLYGQIPGRRLPGEETDSRGLSPSELPAFRTTFLFGT